MRAAQLQALGLLFTPGPSRQAEVFTLACSQVDWNGGFVRLEPGTTKNQEGRAFPITPTGDA
jgi:hypothetical protein